MWADGWHLPVVTDDSVCPRKTVTMPTVSVVVPVHNRISWAVEAVRSVLDQTYADFEVVVVDDGSTEDPTPLRVADERVRYVRQENRGASAARNLGLGLARGRYVAFLDADDLFVPGKLERQATVMEGRPDVAISHTSYLLMDHEGRDIGRYARAGTPGACTPDLHRLPRHRHPDRDGPSRRPRREGAF